MQDLFLRQHGRTRFRNRWDIKKAPLDRVTNGKAPKRDGSNNLQVIGRDNHMSGYRHSEDHFPSFHRITEQEYGMQNATISRNPVVNINRDVPA